MAHLERIYHRNPSRWGRLKDALRGITLGPFNPKDATIARYFGGGTTTAGVQINETNALTYAAVWQAVSLIAGDVGSLPLHLYKRTGNGGKERFTDHPLHYILHDAPNSEMSSLTFRETLQAHLLTWGNAYAEIERDQAGRVVALWPLLPTQVTPFRDDAKRLRYRVAGDGARDTIFEPSNILHVPGLGFDGIVGYSPIRQHRQSLGLLAAAEVFGASFFGNGSTFGGALSHPKVLGDAGQKNLRQSIEAMHSGPDKAHRFLILEEGMGYQKLGVDPNDAQFLETRQFQIAEVARIFNLPLHKLREMEHSSVRANIEQEALDYYVTTLRPWLTRWEGELKRKLISPREKYIQLIEFNLDGVLRGDQATRYNAYSVARQWGWMSVNEIRALENLNPIPDGDMYLVPQNMAPADKIDDIVEAQTREPKPAQPAPAPDSPPADASNSAAERQAYLARLEQQASAIGTLQAQLDMAIQARDSLMATASALEEAHLGCAAVVAERDHLASVAQTLTVERDEALTTSSAVQLRVGELEAAVAAGLVSLTEAQAERDAAVAVRDAAVTAKDTAERALLEARAAHDAISAERDAFGETLAAERQQTLAYRASLITANRVVLLDTLRRMAKREAERARAKRATPAKLLAWAESFYDQYETDLFCDALRPVVTLHQTLIGQPEATEDVVRTMAAEHMAQSLAQIRAVAGKDADQYNAALDATLQRWETQRPEAVVDRFVQEEIRHGR